MKNNLTISGKLTVLRRGLAKYFHCKDNFIKISGTVDHDDCLILHVELNILNEYKSTLSKLHFATYVFDLLFYPDNEDGFIYEDHFYSFANLDSFFQSVSEDMRKL